MPKVARTRYQTLSPPPLRETRTLHLCQSDGCSYSTVNSGDLRRHMKQHLSPEERANHMYKCPICDYEELQRYNVEVHIAKHKELRPFHCPSCEKSYSDPATLTRHKKAKHGHQPHHTARYYLAREEAAAAAKPPSPAPKPKGKKNASSSKSKPASDVPAWSALQDDDFAPPQRLDEPLPSFKDLHLGEAAAERFRDDRGSHRSLFARDADGHYKLPALPTMRPRPLTSMYRAPSSPIASPMGYMSSSPSLSPGPAQWPRSVSPLPDHADDDYYYRSPSASSSTLSERSTQQNYYQFVGRGMFTGGRRSPESEEEMDELEEQDAEFIPYRRLAFIETNCPSKGRTSQGPLFRY